MDSPHSKNRGFILLCDPKQCLDMEICDYPSKCLVQNPVGKNKESKDA